MCLAAVFDAEDADHGARMKFELLLRKQRRGVHYVAASDVEAGEKAVENAHANMSQAHSKLEKAAEVLSAFESSRFAEVTFFLFVKGLFADATLRRRK